MTTAAAPRQAITWSYGMFAPRNWGQDCDAEMRRMNDLWNKLVEIDRVNSAAYRGLIDSALDPVVSGERDAVLAEPEALKAQRKQRYAAARKRVPTPDLDEAIEQVRQRYHALKEQFAAAKKAARATTMAGRRALEVSRQAAVKLARQTSGLYWSNYNAVINSTMRLDKSSQGRRRASFPWLQA
jgi:hypothetical protein